MKIVNLVNSFIGKKGNIGLRTQYIIEELNNENILNFSFSRGIKDKTKNNINMSILGHIPRILNAYRIYFNLWFNHRKYDIKLFEIFFSICFNKKKFRNSIVHIWEHSPYIIKILKQIGCIVILDVPIAPTSTSHKLIKKFPNNILLHPHSFNEKLEVESFELVDYIICPSTFVQNELISLGINSNKIFKVPFGVDLTKTKKKFFSKNYQNGIDFCFAGTINKRKGVDFLLKVWNDPIFKNDRLHLCGRLYPEIRELLDTYNFDNVITPGFINTNDYFHNCDVYIFPSLLEGSSKSIYEAMNASMPCIVTYNSGSIIENAYDGYIVDVADVNGLKEAMNKFKINNSLIATMGTNAFNKIQNYSWSVYSKNIVNIYKEVSK